MQNQTNNRKRKDNFNMTSLSVGNKKKTKVEIDCCCNWYPVWIIVKDWACKKLKHWRRKLIVSILVMKSAESGTVMKILVFVLVVIVTCMVLGQYATKN